MGIIEIVTHPYPEEIYRARLDRAIVTGTELVERPYWYKNTETGQLYFDIYAAIGWPSEVVDSSDGLPGYIAIVGVVRPNKDFGADPKDAKFQLLEEFEAFDVPELLNGCLRLREKYGYNVTRKLLRVWIGDPDRFLTTLALFNERLCDNDSDERKAILITPSDDLYVPKIFDNYIRDIRYALNKDNRRFYFGYNDILQNRWSSGFTEDDPATLAMGGLIHTLLCRCTWMDSCSETAFTVQEEGI